MDQRERQDRIDAHAMGELHAAIATRFGISIQASRQFLAAHKDEVAARRRELMGALADETAQLWITDQAAIQEARQFLFEDTLRRRAAPDLPARDVSRFNRDLDQLAYKASELAGLIRQRVHAEVETAGKATYEIVGVDLNQVIRS